MSRYLFFILFLFGTIIVHAQENSEQTDSVLYQQALQAFQDQKFILKIESYEDYGDYGDRVRPVKPVKSKSYVVMWNGNMVISCYPAENNASAVLRGGRVANYRMKTEKKGNLIVTMNFSDRSAGDAKLIFRLKQGSNHCELACIPVRHFYKLNITGKLFPYKKD